MTVRRLIQAAAYRTIVAVRMQGALHAHATRATIPHAYVQVHTNLAAAKSMHGNPHAYRIVWSSCSLRCCGIVAPVNVIVAAAVLNIPAPLASLLFSRFVLLFFLPPFLLVVLLCAPLSSRLLLISERDSLQRGVQLGLGSGVEGVTRHLVNVLH
jgi:hypothetical protein